jgi:Xaa-Pro dipeptidase
VTVDHSICQSRNRRCLPADGGSRSRFVDDRAVEAGDLVAMRAGVLVDGWEASLARTWPAGQPSAGKQRRFLDWQMEWSTVTGSARGGSYAGDLRAPDGVTVHGVGLGYEGLADDDVLEPGMVVSLELERAGIVGADLFLVEADGAEPLTRFPSARSNESG